MLTHWCRPPLGRRHFQMQFVYENRLISLKISLNVVPKGPIDNKSSLVPVMAWCRKGDKPLREPMITQSSDAYMRHSAQWVNSSSLGIGYGIVELGHHWFMSWFVTCSTPSHYLNQWWLIVRCAHGNNLWSGLGYLLCESYWVVLPTKVTFWAQFPQPGFYFGADFRIRRNHFGRGSIAKRIITAAFGILT